MLKEAANRHPDRKALVLPDAAYTYGDLLDQSEHVANALLHLGVRRNDRICVWLPNSIEWVATALGAARIGVIVAPLNLRFKEADAAYVIRQLDPTLLIFANRIARTDYVDILEKILPEIRELPADRLRTASVPSLRHVVSLEECGLPGVISYRGLLRDGMDSPALDLPGIEASVEADDVIHIQYTSGTTSRPKGAMLTHASLVRNAAETSIAMGIGADDPIFSAAPLFHCGAFVGGLLMGMFTGNAFVTMGHFDAGESVRLIAAEECTVFRGPQTILAGIADYAARSEVDISSLRGGICGSSTLSARLDLSERLNLRDMVTIYGISEGSTAVTMTTVTDPFPARLESVGRPLPGMEVRIADIKTGESVSRGSQGEICFRGWGLMKGYFAEPAETAKVVDADGWFHSGDLGRMDEDGTLFYAGRLKDVIRVGGENVSAAEVENWLDLHPSILMAQVVAAPDERLGEVCVAFVRLVDGQVSTPNEIIDYCRGAMASFKTPREVYVVDSFPLTGSGKVMKPALRAWAEERMSVGPTT